MAHGAETAGGRVYRAEAVVLRRISTGETDRVVTLFTRDRGKLNAIAKGARGPRSKLAGATEPFTFFQGLLAVGQNLDVLTQAEVRDSFSTVRKDMERIGYATYFLEIVDVGLEERQPAPELWELLVAALSSLEAATMPDILARAFELHAMATIGYEPQLHRCVLDAAAVDAPGAGFHPIRGGMLCARCARSTHGTVLFSDGTLRALNSLTRGPLVRMSSAPLPETARRELARSLVPYVRHHLDAPLRSLQFLDDVAAPL